MGARVFQKDVDDGEERHNAAHAEQ